MDECLVWYPLYMSRFSPSSTFMLRGISKLLLFPLSRCCIGFASRADIVKPCTWLLGPAIPSPFERLGLVRRANAPLGFDIAQLISECLQQYHHSVHLVRRIVWCALAGETLHINCCEDDYVTGNCQSWLFISENQNPNQLFRLSTKCDQKHINTLLRPSNRVFFI